MDWPRLLAYITGTVDQELLLRNEYLAAENRILRAKIKDGYNCQTARSPRWPKSLIGLAARPWRKSPWPPNPTPF